MRIIVVQTAFAGDVILTLPMCAAIRKVLPQAEIVFVTTPTGASIVEGLEIIDRTVVFDKRGVHSSFSESIKLAREIGNTPDTIAIVPHKSFRTAVFVRALKARTVVTYSDAATRWVSTHKVRPNRNIHEAQRHLELLSALLQEVPVLDNLLPITLHGAHTVPVYGVSSAQARKPLAVLAPGSAWATKRWPDQKWHELAEMLVNDGMEVAVIGAPGDADIFGASKALINLCGLTSLQQVALLIGKASVLISNDSAPVHIASMQCIPVVAIFGPTVPEFGFGPIGARTAVVERHGLGCRPCSIHGTAKCPLGTLECLTNISAMAVHAAVVQLLHAHDENRNATTTQNQVSIKSP